MIGPALIAKNCEDFTCCGCGSCCRGWNVQLDAPAKSAMEEALKKKPHPVYGSEIPYLNSGDNMYLKMVDGHCVYLGHDNSCFLHSNLGPEIKPAVCRTFPRRLATTPQGVFVTMTPSCHRAADILLKDNELRFLEGTVHQPVDPEARPYSLSPDAPITIEQMNRIENHLLSILGRSDRKAPSNLLLACETADRLAHILRAQGPREMESHLDQKAPPESPVDPPKVADQVRILNALITYRRKLADGLETPASLQRLLTLIADTYALDKPDARPPATVRLNRAFRSHLEPSMNCLNGVITNYLKHQLTSRIFTYNHGTGDGLRIICLLYFLVRATAAAYASNDSCHVSEKHFARAIAEVEREFAHSQIVLSFWKQILDIPGARKEAFLRILAL